MAKETDAEELWRKLEFIFVKKTALKKAFIIKEMVNMKLNEDVSVAVYFLNNIHNVINQLATMDELLALLLLGTLLLEGWEIFVVP